jgi:hypothetical protein
MDRREFIGAVSLGLLTAPLSAEAQQAGRVYRLGILTPAAGGSGDRVRGRRTVPGSTEAIQ